MFSCRNTLSPMFLIGYLSTICRISIWKLTISLVSNHTSAKQRVGRLGALLSFQCNHKAEIWVQINFVPGAEHNLFLQKKNYKWMCIVSSIYICWYLFWFMMIFIIILWWCYVDYYDDIMIFMMIFMLILGFIYLSMLICGNFTVS